MTDAQIDILFESSFRLLRALIATPSYSREEGATAALIRQSLEAWGIPVEIRGFNIIARTPGFDPLKPTYLLNSHHDTVKPASGYTRDPFEPVIEEEKLYGLGSNDAGASLVALLAAFRYFYGTPGLPFNLVFAATAEEEISGSGGIESILPFFGKIDGALVGEPTKMQLAVAERGLMVLDAVATGRAGHAARKEGENALYKAVHDIALLQQISFDKDSALLGPTTAQATIIETANKAHNVVPDECRFVIDVRVNEQYSLEQILELLQSRLQSRLTPRSMRLRSSVIAQSHPLVQAGLALGKKCYGSPTTSDKALMPFPALKIGPGDSARSHTADEFIGLAELREGIEDYIQLLNHLA